MLPNVSRGYSFKGLTDYLRYDKGANENERLTTSERVAFIETMNFDADPAEDLAKAATFMGWTWAIREDLKEKAGIKPGGRSSAAPPVWHSSLSWKAGDPVDRAEMERAAGSYLKAQGLGLDRGYQTVFVCHTDTANPHMHIVVNLVHPVNGKQANPWNDRDKAQQWGRDYDKARGADHCPDREAKYAALDRQRASTARQAAFNDNAKGRTRQTRRGEADHVTSADRFGRDRTKARETIPRPARVPYHQWKAQQDAKRQAKDADFRRTKATLDSRYAAMRAAETAGQHRRNTEYERLRDDRKAARNSIYEKYQSALDAVWNPQPGPKEAGTDRTAWQAVNEHLNNRKIVFEDQEQGLLGRFRNARDLLGYKASLFVIARLAINGAERRKLFDLAQRRIATEAVPPRQARPKGTPRPNTPEPRRVQAEWLKAMRAAELAEHDRQTRAAFAAMKGRHQFKRTAESAARTAHAAESKAAWQQFHQAHPQQSRRDPTPANDRTPPANENDQADSGRPADQAEAPAQKGEPKADRFGRSRNRQPRAPREQRADARAENLAKEAAPAFEGYDPGQPSEAIQTPPVGQGEPNPEGFYREITPEEAKQLAEMEEARRRSREADRQQGYDQGRELEI